MFCVYFNSIILLVDQYNTPFISSGDIMIEKIHVIATYCFANIHCQRSGIRLPIYIAALKRRLVDETKSIPLSCRDSVLVFKHKKHFDLMSTRGGVLVRYNTHIDCC